MAFTEHYRESVLNEARENIKRAKREQGKARTAGDEPRTTPLGPSPVIETREERWRREDEESEAKARREREKNGQIKRTQQSVEELRGEMARIEADVRGELVESLKGINTFADAVSTQIEMLEAVVEGLQAKLAISEARINDLVLARTPPGEVIDLPKRRA
jgi:hypothetical protein